MIEIIKFEPMDKGSLKAKFGVKMHKWGGFCMEELSLLSNGSKKWIGFPAKKIELDGKDKWIPLSYFDSPSLQKRFCEEVLKALEEYKKTHSVML